VIGKISCPADTSIIPVVYITNHTFHHFRKEDAESLAQKVFSKIDSIAKENSISYNEIQIDCDWSDSTRELYFSFLGKMKSISQKTISTTIRLHQVKYFERTGIPENYVQYQRGDEESYSNMVESASFGQLRVEKRNYKNER
jgi:hypothetical protein